MRHLQEHRSWPEQQAIAGPVYPYIDLNLNF
jgi:hypothetical protein